MYTFRVKVNEGAPGFSDTSGYTSEKYETFREAYEGLFHFNYRSHWKYFRSLSYFSLKKEGNEVVYVNSGINVKDLPKLGVTEEEFNEINEKMEKEKIEENEKEEKEWLRKRRNEIRKRRKALREEKERRLNSRIIFKNTITGEVTGFPSVNKAAEETGFPVCILEHKIKNKEPLIQNATEIQIIDQSDVSENLWIIN